MAATQYVVRHGPLKKHRPPRTCRRGCLSNELREAYGVTSEEAERQIKSFEARNQHPRPVS